MMFHRLFVGPSEKKYCRKYKQSKLLVFILLLPMNDNAAIYSERLRVIQQQGYMISMMAAGELAIFQMDHEPDTPPQSFCPLSVYKTGANNCL